MWRAAIAVAVALWGPAPGPVAYHVAQLGEPWGMAIQHEAGWWEVQVKARRWSWRDLCTVVVHETGHVHGLGHSRDPMNVMYPRVVREADACRGKRPAQYRRGAVIDLK